MNKPLIASLTEHAEYYHAAALNAEDTALTEYLRARTQLSHELAAQLSAADSQIDPQTTDELEPEYADGSALAGLNRGLTTVMAAMTIRPDKTDERVLMDARKVDERLLETYRQVLDQEDLPPADRTLVERQYGQLQAVSAYSDAHALDPSESIVLGLFADRDMAEEAVAALQRAGFDEDRLGIIANATTVSDLLDDRRMELAGDSAGVAALGGTFLGGLLGLLAGVGVLLVPGVGAVLALGAGAAVLGWTAVGAGIGATYGAFFGTLIGWGIAEDDVQRFLAAVEVGEILLVVHTTVDDAAVAAQQLVESGSTDVVMRTSEQTAQIDQS